MVQYGNSLVLRYRFELHHLVYVLSAASGTAAIKILLDVVPTKAANLRKTVSNPSEKNKRRKSTPDSHRHMA